MVTGAGRYRLTYYRALEDVPEGRHLLLERPWGAWRDDILAELAAAHPDLPVKTSRIDITRYGHAMATPVPRNLRQTGLQPASNVRSKLPKLEQVSITHERLAFAHSDWAGYPVLEEAFTLGHAAGVIG